MGVWFRLADAQVALLLDITMFNILLTAHSQDICLQSYLQNNNKTKYLINLKFDCPLSSFAQLFGLFVHHALVTYDTTYSQSLTIQKISRIICN